MKTIEDLETEYKNFETKSTDVNSLEKFLNFINIGIDDTYEIEGDYKKERRENKFWQFSARIRNIFNFLFIEEETEFYDYDNKILDELTTLVLTYRTYYEKMIELSNQNNYLELVKLTDFLIHYYSQHIDYYEYRRNKLEMEIQGYSFYNSKYENNQEVVAEFVEKKLSEFEQAQQKEYGKKNDFI